MSEKLKPLRDRIDDLPDDEEICIGSGTNWHWCGSKEGFLKHEPEISTRIKKSTTHALASCESRLATMEHLVDRIAQLRKEIPTRGNLDKIVTITADGHTAELTMREFSAILTSAKEKSQTGTTYAKTTIKNHKKALDSWENLIDRKVQRIGRTPCRDRFRVILTGSEVGRFWTAKECKEVYDD